MPTNGNDSTHVSTGKPKTGGAIFAAPLGTTLPTDASSALDAAFKCLGYCSEDGLTNTISRSINQVREWGGAVVDSSLGDFNDTYAYTLIETTNVEVAKHVFGSAAVTTTTGGYKLSVGPVLPDACVLICETIHKGYIKRQVLPKAQVTEIGEVVYRRDQAVGYAVTTEAQLDAAGYTHYEYVETA